MPAVTAARVTVIPAKKDRLPINVLSNEARKLRVAAYARVSTNNEEQLTSYEAQVDYYTRYIQSKDEWQFVEVYTDEGISATNTKKRDGFNRMVADALAGKIDLIITKSISRFARNTVDTLTTVRKLKEKGIEVFFEKENIRTLDGKGELLITIMSSLAQEESRSISENVTWGQRKRFADGKVSLPYRRFLGYEKGRTGCPVIVESEAVIIRLIYRLFLYGKSPSAIATYLTDEGIPTPGGKKVWRAKVVESILTNEKYKGDALLPEEIHGGFPHQKAKGQRGRSAAVLCDEQPSGHYRTGAFRPRTIRAENPQDGWAFYKLPASIFRAHYLRRVWRHLWQQGLALQHGKPEPCMAV